MAETNSKTWFITGTSRGFGIHVTLIEPGGFSTDWGRDSASHAEELPAYAELHEKTNAARKSGVGNPGDPAAPAASKRGKSGTMYPCWHRATADS